MGNYVFDHLSKWLLYTLSETAYEMYAIFITIWIQFRYFLVHRTVQIVQKHKLTIEAQVRHWIIFFPPFNQMREHSYIF